ncbi:MAG: hypothetical protein GXO66_04060 [Euryarchaeota archaeon]|nr:hypothetical protein [Euryarchaeota archaeon]
MRVLIYDEGCGEEVDLGELARYLSERGARVELRGGFFARFASLEDAAREIAGMRISDPMKPVAREEPLYGEVRYELRVLQGKARAGGVLYDGFALQHYMRSLLPGEEVSLERLHLVITPRLLATFSEEDRRYHLRAIILGYPALISTSGIVEAPAKPREFYLQRRLLGEDALAEARLKQKLREKLLDYGDPRLGEVLRGYALQALFYQLFGEAFCENRRCRLYNAHWQEELIEAQLSQPELCERHEKMLKEWREKATPP